MEYFNKYTPEYTFALKKSHKKYKIKLELLTYYETVIGEITKDISVSAQGQININWQQLVRRSCSLTLINVDKKYVPSPNNWFWYERKFKLWIGVVDGNDVYWWSQGIFITKSATADKSVVNIEAVDKGGILDGTLKTNMTEVDYIVETGTPISTLIKDSLLTNIYGDARIKIGGDKPIDPIAPIIDMKFNNIPIQSEIILDTNNYLGTMLVDIADSYGADIYYNTHGHLVFSSLTDGNRVDGFKYMAHQWDFTDSTSEYSNANFEYTFDGINAVTVYTDTSTLENVSYTAYNTNPLSPLRVGYIGIRRMEDQEISYIDVDIDEMKTRCKQYAQYLLLKESISKMSINFNSAIIPHLDVGRTIGITDRVQGINAETFVINSITMPLSSGEMSISATNITWLPSDTNVEGGVA